MRVLPVVLLCACAGAGGSKDGEAGDTLDTDRSSQWVKDVFVGGGSDVAAPRREFPLSEVPDPDTLEVHVEDGAFTYEGVDRVELGRDAPLGELCPSVCFWYDHDRARNVVVFDAFAPSPDATVCVRYLPASDG